MNATEQEVTWARNIKNAALAKGLEPVSDFMYLQMAIISKEKTKKAVARLEKMDQFRKRYNLSDGVPENAMEYLGVMFQRFPEMLGAMGRDEQGRAVIVVHVSKYTPGDLTENDWTPLQAANLCFLHAINSDINAIRSGYVSVSDCGGMGWRNFSLLAQKKNSELFADCYPIRISHVHLLNTPSIVSLHIPSSRSTLNQRLLTFFILDFRHAQDGTSFVVEEDQGNDPHWGI